MRGFRRDWKSIELQQYTQDHGGVGFRRYVSTGLLPIVVDGKRLSDFYPVAKFGGAITVVDRTIVILDRLGGLYRYDLTTGLFEPLRSPRLPNNLKAYLERSETQEIWSQASHINNAHDQFRAHGITFISDRNELAVAYDEFDTTLGKLRTAVSVIPINAMTLEATGAWRQIFVGDAYSPGSASSSGGRMAYRGAGQLYLTLGDHYTTEPKVARSEYDLRKGN